MPPKNVKKNVRELRSGLVRFMPTTPEEILISGEEMAWLEWQRELRELRPARREARKQQ